MDDIESIGLLKMDFLGLRTLTVIDDALDLIEKDTGERLDITTSRWTTPRPSPFPGRHTDGVFQFESPGMKDLLRRSARDSGTSSP